MHDVSPHLHQQTAPERPAAQSARDGQRLTVLLAAGMLLGAAWPVSGMAAGSRAAVEATPGEIVVMRAVPARHAARSMPPGRALLIDPSPNPQLDSGLSQLEITSDSYGQIAAGGQGARGGVVAGSMSSFMSPLVGNQSSGNRTPAPKAATGGAMSAATKSIGSQVAGALAGAGLLGQGGAGK